MDLTTLGVVILDTTIVPDVFGLHAFDDRAPVVRVLPGEFSNTVWVLVPVGFHDGISQRIGGKAFEHTGLSCQAGNGTKLNLAERMLVVLSVYRYA